MTLLGGGDLNPADLAESLSLAPKLVAADSGADAALSLGYRPCAVVGDLDSISDHARVSLPDGAFIHVAEQESTDFHKALSRIDAPGVLALGFTGGRSDHELAAWHTLMAQRAPRIGTRVSLFPLAPVSGTSQGLEWPIDGLDFAPGRRIGTSNRSVAASVRLTMDAAAMLVILPKAHLRIVCAALF